MQPTKSAAMQDQTSARRWVTTRAMRSLMRINSRDRRVSSSARQKQHSWRGELREPRSCEASQDLRHPTLARQKRNRKVSLPAMYRTDCRSCERISSSRSPSQPRNCWGARSMAPDQPLRARAPLISAKLASWRKDSNDTPGPLENVNAKSPLFEKRMITSPINVVPAVRYKSCPLRIFQSPAGSAN